MKTIYITREIPCIVCESQDSKITSPESLSEYMSEVISPDQEEIYCLFLNIQNKVMERHQIAKGGDNSILVTPSNIFKPAILAGAKSIIIYHNHPSGDLSPSKEDLSFTEKIVAAGKIIGIELLDHVIGNIAGESYSFRQKKIIK
jgi:DNA repair protein RadC